MSLLVVGGVAAVVAAVFGAGVLVGSKNAAKVNAEKAAVVSTASAVSTAASAVKKAV